MLLLTPKGLNIDSKPKTMNSIVTVISSSILQQREREHLCEYHETELIKQPYMKRVWSDLSNSLTIHDVITQLERHIRVRWMTLKLNETLVFHHVFITSEKVFLICIFIDYSTKLNMNRAFLINNGQEKHFKLQTNKLKSFEIKVSCIVLRVTETDWHSIHIHILRNFFYTRC